MAGFRAQRLVARDPRGTVGFRTIAAGPHRVRLALLRDGGSVAVAILHPEGEDTMATRRTNPSRKQRERSERKARMAYNALLYRQGHFASSPYRPNKQVRAEAASDPGLLRDIFLAKHRGKQSRKGRTVKYNPPRAPKRSARTGRFVRG